MYGYAGSDGLSLEIQMGIGDGHARRVGKRGKRRDWIWNESESGGLQNASKMKTKIWHNRELDLNFHSSILIRLIRVVVTVY